MSVFLYGVPVETAGRIAGRYDLKIVRSLEETRNPGTMFLIPQMTAPRQLLAFYNAMLNHEDDVDAVIVCGIESCGASSTVRYCSPQGKLFSVNCGSGDGELEYEISRIIETRLGLVCAHEGL